jgi:hypothetical protein
MSSLGENGLIIIRSKCQKQYNEEIQTLSGWWLKNILKNMSSSMGRMTSQYMKWKIKHVSNHQTVIYWYTNGHEN